MLSTLQIKNFKAWRDTGTIRLAPITVFFGANSAGKTSLLQFLLMLKQTAESPDRKRVLHPGDPYTLVELGAYRDLVYGHDLQNEISFSLSWTPIQEIAIRDPVSSDSYAGDGITFAASIGNDSKNSQFLRSVRYSLAKHRSPVLSVGMSPTAENSRTYELEAEGYSLRRNPGRVWKLPAPIRFYGFPDEVVAYYQNAGFTSELALQLELQLRRVHHLGPLREDPSRIYTWSGEVPEHAGIRGERAVEAILAAADRKIAPGKGKKAIPFAEMISKWLDSLELLQRFEAKPIAKDRKEYEVVVEVQGTNLSVLLPDVGFGVSQVLPVVVECFYAPSNSTIIIEQPELHLHPRVQSSLADLFIEAVHARESYSDRAVQLLIESHSEHFLRRLQRRVAEGVIEPDEVALYFCERAANGSILRPLEVDLYGDILNWPENFFGDEMSDLAARLEAASVREAKNS